MRQLLNVEYSAERESVSVDGDGALVRWRSELERPPPGRRRGGRPLSYVTDELDELMRTG